MHLIAIHKSMDFATNEQCSLKSIKWLGCFRDLSHTSDAYSSAQNMKKVKVPPVGDKSLLKKILIFSYLLLPSLTTHRK